MTELIISEATTSTLAEKYKTPLCVYGEGKMRQTMLSFKRGFVSKHFDTKVFYASKAFQTTEMLHLVREYGSGLDVVSGEEIYTTLQAGFSRDIIYFHDNNKTSKGLIYVLKDDLLHIVADNLMEVELLAELNQRCLKKIRIVLQLNVGVEAHTHRYIITMYIDSELGMSYESRECQQALWLIKERSYLELEGFHAHIRSQIFDVVVWLAEIDELTNYLTNLDQPLSLNLGGGFGIRYTQNDQPIPVEGTPKKLVEYTEEALEKRKLTTRQLLVEPGKSIVGEAGITLYTIGFTRKTPHKKYYFVDGGMTDNTRPTLYQAEYGCNLAAKLSEEKTEKVTIAGKMCKSGDVVIKETYLPKAEPGDLLAVCSTGAYGYLMSSNYNRMTQPTVVSVNND